MARGAAATAAALLVLPTAAPLPAVAEPVVAEELQFMLARDPDSFRVQKTMVEAFAIVQETFVERPPPPFYRELAARLNAVAEAGSPGEARAQIPGLLASLGDPYTRYLPPKQYADFRIGNDGGLSGVGMMIASDPESGRCAGR